MTWWGERFPERCETTSRPGGAIRVFCSEELIRASDTQRALKETWGRWGGVKTQQMHMKRSRDCICEISTGTDLGQDAQGQREPRHSNRARAEYV